MSFTIEHLLLVGSLLLFTSIIASKTSGRLGVPTLVLFMVIGMAVGSDGLGLIWFDNAELAQGLGIVALVFILFSGGLDTKWESVRPVIGKGLMLSTVGVLITALIIGVVLPLFTELTMLEGLLMGAIVSSTDAAAVFTILRSRNVRLKANLRPLLELESGSNDPMAFFLTVGLTGLIGGDGTTPWSFLGTFLVQMAIGAVAGIGMGKLMTFIINRVKLEFDGLYPVLVLALVMFTFAATDAIGGNGFLSVYLAGILFGNTHFIHKKSLIRFYDGQAWLMQIIMFLTLGLLVFPREVVPVMGIGLLISTVLIVVARPVAVFISLAPFRGMTWRQKAFVSWVGLRGAVPIVLATYPLTAGLAHADIIFNVVFFAVITSVVLQGSTLPLVAELLRVARPKGFRQQSALDMELNKELSGTLLGLRVAAASPAVGHLIVDLHFPKDAQIILIEREGEFLTPDGSTELAAGDRLLVMARKPKQLEPVMERLVLEAAPIPTLAPVG